MYRLALVIFGAILLAVKVDCKVVSHIINGREAGRVVMKEWKKYVHTTTEFPYMAALESDDNYICGAVIIKRDRLLTAAHCIQGGRLSVRAGTFIKDDKFGRFVQKRIVTETIIHKKYQPTSDDYDIAILKLDEPLEFGDYVNGIELAKDSQMESFTGEKVIALGFGEIENYHRTATLKRMDLKVFHKADCKRMVSHITNKMICTMGYDQPSGVGKGDSGSPLVAEHNPKNPKEDILIGIVIDCVTGGIPLIRCNLDYPSVYADVAVFREWIDKNI